MKQIVIDQPERVSKWVTEQQGRKFTSARGTGIGLEVDGELIAGVLFDSWNGASMYVHIAALPGRVWANREFLRICFAYAFQQVQCKKLIGMAGSKNFKARRFDEHIGFVLEATLKDAHPDGDLIIYTMTKEQCRWL